MNPQDTRTEKVFVEIVIASRRCLGAFDSRKKLMDPNLDYVVVGKALTRFPVQHRIVTQNNF